MVDLTENFKGIKGIQSFGLSRKGGGIKTTIAGVGGDNTFSEKISGAVKDSVRKFLERRDQRILELALAPGDENEAQLCWGGLNNNNPRSSISNKVISRDPTKDPDKPQDQDKIFRWREQERFVVKTKITNPQDSEQYIWVNVCKVSIWSAPSQEPFNGKKHLFEFVDKSKETCIAVDHGT